jgi:outer membrane receptor protein involved in Fe transport
MDQKIIFTILLSLLTSTVFSQISIQGKVYTKNQKPLDEFNVSLLKADSKELIKGGFFIDGSFQIGNIPKDFLLHISSLGYQDTLLSIHAETNIKLSNIILNESHIQLADVIVKAKRQLYQQKGDQLILNVEKTILEEVGLASDVLKKSVKSHLDQNNNVNILGKGKADVYVNGKKIQSNEILQLIPSEEIKSVEIIENSSVKYASNSLAVVNIITKKKDRIGSGVKISNTLSKRNDFENHSNIQLTQQNFKNNFYASYSFYNKKRKYDNLYIRDYGIKKSSSYIINNMVEKLNLNQNHSLRINDEINLSKQANILLSLNSAYYKGGFDKENSNEIYRNEQKEGLQKSIFSTVNSKIDRKLLNGVATFEQKWKQNTLNVSAERYYYKSNQNDHITEQIINIYEKKNQLENRFNFSAFEIDYTNQTQKNTTVQSGVRLSNYKNNSHTKYLNPASRKDFLNQENEWSAFTTMHYNKNKWSIKTGIRMEYTTRKADVNKSRIVDRNDYEWISNLSISKELNKSTNLNFSYSKSLIRPSFQDLNPNINYIDTLSYIIGNPNLKKTKINHFNVKLSYMKYASLSLFYKKTKDAIIWHIDFDPNNPQVAVGTQKNISNQNSYGVNLVLPYQSKQYTVYLASGFEQINHSNQLKHLNRLKWYVKSGLDYSLPFDIRANFTALYFSDGINGFWNYRSAYQIDTGFQKKFHQNRLSVSLDFSDIFRSYKMKSKADFNGRKVNYNYYYDNQQIRLRISYSFNKLKNKVKSKSLLQQERNRIKSQFK